MSLAVRLGLLDPPGQPLDRRPTVLLQGSRDAVEAVLPATDAALRRRPDLGLVIAVPEAERDALQQRFSHERVVAGPPANAITAMLWRRRLRVALSLDAGPPTPDTDSVLRLLPPPRSGGHDGGSALARALVSASGARRITSLDAMKAALDAPDTIVCLGNGPTSESPALAAYGSAALFRVNWTWRGRGVMADPDAVFTADPDVPPAGSRAILVLPREAAAWRVLVQHVLAGRPPRPGFLFLDATEPPVADFDAAEIPTNGALMVAVAAALRPRRLAIAGMDLYRHAEGRYPGATAVDGYARGHSAECDLALIGKALAGFGGVVEILSPNLAAALGR